jgi:hypothetical protein
MLDLSISTRLEGEADPVVSRPTMGTLLALERHFKLDSAVMALQQTKLEHVAWLAWKSRQQAGLVVPLWETFRDTIADMSFDTNDDPLADAAPPTN